MRRHPPSFVTPLLPQVLFVLSLTLALPVSAAQPEPAAREWLRSGPMPGMADIQGTVLWLQTRDPRSVVVHYWPEGEPEAARLGPSVETGPAGDHIAKITLSGLRFGTVYRYELYLDGHRVASPDPDEPWRFHTQAMWRWRTDPPSFTFAIGSCAYVNDPPFDRPGKPYGSEFEIFDQVAAQRPAFMLWLGDNIYLKDADWLSEQGIRHRYAQNRELPELQRLLAATHHLAIWDDHDYGSDNSDRTFPLRDASLEIFRDYWANPSMGTRELPGAFGRFEWHDVEFFLLDDRFHRTPNAWPAGPDKVMYGAAQMRWLKESLLSSQATFKIVAGGNQFLNPMLYDPSWQELWEMFPDEKQDFLEFLTNSQVEGVLFLSGDRHHSELLELEREGLYPLYEYTSSSLTAGTAYPKKETDNPIRVPGTWVTYQHNFGLITVEGPKDDRVLLLRALGPDGIELWSHRISRRELAVDKGQEAPQP